MLRKFTKLNAWVVVLYIMMGNPIPAESGNGITDRFINFFVGACLHTLPDVDRVKAIARMMKWKPLDGDRAALFAPAEKNAEWQGWVAVEGDDIFIVGVSRSKINNKPGVSCVVSVRGIDQNQLTRKMRDTLNLNLMSDEIEALQRYQTWKSEINGRPVMINLTTFANQILTPATLAGIAWE